MRVRHWSALSGVRDRLPGIRHQIAGSPDRSIDWGFVEGWVGRIVLLGAFPLAATNLGHFYLRPPYENLFIDAHIYFRATDAWVNGGNPWLPMWNGIPFAAPPPALLLNLPLLPFGETFAVAFWVSANSLSILYLLRRFQLPPYWFLFYPIFEGTLGATPDLTLAALVVAGGGAISALTKPYAVPAMLAGGQWRAVLVAAVVLVTSFPFLPWGQFQASQAVIAHAFEHFTNVVSAFGQPLLMVGTAVALCSLGGRLGLGLATPGLLAQQPHYLAFSLQFIATSRLLTVFATLPYQHAAAFGIIVYAVLVHIRRRHGVVPPLGRRRKRNDGATPIR